MSDTPYDIVLYQDQGATFEGQAVGGGGGGSSSAFSELLEMDAQVTFADLTGNLVLAASDFTVRGQKGTDLSLGDSVSQPGSAAIFTASGGTFGAQIYLGAGFTADAGSTNQRFLNWYLNSSPEAASPTTYFGGYPFSLGLDKLTPLAANTSIDDMGPVVPYVDIVAGGEFATALTFYGVQGTALDSVHLNIILLAWKLADLT